MILVLTASFFGFTLAPACPGGPRGPGKPCDPFIINNKQKKLGD